MNCSHCSATIPGDALTCAYCGHETPNVANVRALAEERKRHVEQQALIDASNARKASVDALDASARTAIYWSLAGVLVCCLPVGSIVGLVLGLRVRRSATVLKAPAPWQSMAAIVVSIVWLAFFLFALILGVITEHQKSARVAELRAATKGSAAAPDLDADTACALIEMTLLEGGAGREGGALDLFRCEGLVEKTATGGAVIKDIEFARASSDKPLRVDGCLSRGSRWKVDAIGTGPGCHAGYDAGN